MTARYAPLPTKEEPSSPSSTSSPTDSAPTSSKLLGESYSPPSRQFSPSTRHAIVRALTTTLACWVVGFVVGGIGLAVLAPDVAGRALSGLRSCGGTEGEGSGRRWKRQAEGAAGGGAEYSTTTYEGGKGATSTFVKTTRPIVNPGGYTIGTLTGFVPVSTTTLPTSPSAPSSSDPPSASASASSANATTVTSSVAAPTTTADSTEASPTLDEPSFTRSNPFVHPISTAPFAPSASSTGPERKLFKRQSPSNTTLPPAATVTATAAGKEESSTSMDTRKGRETTVTLVKTTRPIVNAGGYTIGTLDGAWVDVAKQTDRPSVSSPSSLPSSSPSATSEPDAPADATDKPEKRAHEELRRRNVVHLVGAEEE
ncbi:hypothetical protein JCM10296v2_006874 [Rhodotorula toruloides]